MQEQKVRYHSPTAHHIHARDGFADCCGFCVPEGESSFRAVRGGTAWLSFCFTEGFRKACLLGLQRLRIKCLFRWFAD